MTKIENKYQNEIHGREELLPVLALRNTVLFPQQVIPIYIGREKSLQLIEDYQKTIREY